MPFTRLAESVTTLYAELLDQLRAADAAQPPRGSYVSKTIRGSRHWYLQTVSAGRKQQQYLARSGNRNFWNESRPHGR